jgi:alpha-1,6-mannosyltransferase
VSIGTVVSSGLLGLALGLLLTVPLDSYFWLRFPLWPELSAFAFNILHGQSSNWGTSPFLFYFTSALPRLLFNPLTYQIFAPLAIAVPRLRSQVLDILIPNLAFVVIYSFQPHKEWRFIIYIIPPFLAISAAGASWVWTRRYKSRAFQLLALCLVASSLASFGASFAMLAISRLNYPGAQALNHFHALTQQSSTEGVMRVHMDTLTCMTGVTRFLQIHPPISSRHADEEATHPTWIYDKTDDPSELLHPAFWEPFDYAMAERPELVIGKWEIIDTVRGFTGVTILRPGETRYGEAAGGNLDEDAGSSMWGAGKGWRGIERWIRKHVTRGWWIGVRMEPRIRVLKKQKDGN